MSLRTTTGIDRILDMFTSPNELEKGTRQTVSFALPYPSYCSGRKFKRGRQPYLQIDIVAESTGPLRGNARQHR